MAKVRRVDQAVQRNTQPKAYEEGGYIPPPPKTIFDGILNLFSEDKRMFHTFNLIGLEFTFFYKC